MKILIVNSHLETGGIRQSLLNLLENIKELNLDIDLQLLKYDESIIRKYEQLNKVNVCKPIRLLNSYLTPFSKQKNILNKIIKVIFWSLSKFIGNKKTIDLIMNLVRKKGEYDVAISFSNDIWASHVNGFCGGCNDYVIRKINANTKIAWIHNEPEKLGLTYEICKNTYKYFDYIVNVSFACKKKFDEIIPEYQYKSKVIYNMLDFERIRELSSKENPYKEQKIHIVTVARLDNQQKRIDRIIKCCEKLKLEGIINFKWHIVGDGPDGEWLKLLSKEKKTEDIITFEGKKDNPYTYMKYADVFVQTSDYEAYSMVLLESLAVERPIICTRYDSVAETVIDGKNGILIDKDEEKLFNIIKIIIQNPHLIKTMENYIKLNNISNERALQQFIDILGD